MIDTFTIFKELSNKFEQKTITDKLFIHTETRWIEFKKIPKNYFNDINHLLGDKYKQKYSTRDKDHYIIKII